MDAVLDHPVHDWLNWLAHCKAERYSPDQSLFAWDRASRQHSAFPGLGQMDNNPQARALLAAQLHQTGDPEDGTREEAGNLLVTVGLNLITNLLIGGTTAGSIKFAQAINGVGTGVTAAAVGDTALTNNGTANAYYQQADSGFPTQSNGVMTMQSTFASGVANFAWNEWCWASCTSGTITAGTTLASVATGVVLWNHKVPASSLGTKSAGAAWVFTTTITLS